MTQTPGTPFQLSPGSLPPNVDPPSCIPQSLPAFTPPSERERYDRTPIYDNLTFVLPVSIIPANPEELKWVNMVNRTNVPDIAMSYSDLPFSYGPFAPHWVPKQYIENYFSSPHTDQYLIANTTVENVSRLESTRLDEGPRWSLTLRRFNAIKQQVEWWQESFDAVIIANGHYSIPYVGKIS